MNTLRWTILAGWVLMFGAGFAAGMLVAQRTEPRQKTYLGRLASEYDLRPEQVSQIHSLLDKERETIDSVLDRVEGVVKDDIQIARRRTVEEIRLVLDDGEQRRRFDEDMMQDGSDGKADK